MTAWRIPVVPLLGWWHWCWHGNLVDLQGARGVSSALAEQHGFINEGEAVV